MVRVQIRVRVRVRVRVAKIRIWAAGLGGWGVVGFPKGFGIVFGVGVEPTWGVRGEVGFKLGLGFSPPARASHRSLQLNPNPNFDRKQRRSYME